MKLPTLPVTYYLDHFEEMLGFVARTYGPILTDEHHAFMARFGGFSKDARCLLIRMINRRGAIFDRTHFRYAEIDDIARAIAELAAHGHARGLVESDYAAFLACQAKDRLLAGAKAAGLADVRASWPKLALIDYYLASVPFATAFQHCGGDSFVALDNIRPVEFLLYLYFGKTEQDLKSFTLRDLGIIRTNEITSFSGRFTDGDEARACFHYSRLLDRLALKSPAIDRQVADDVLDGPACNGDYAQDLRSRAAHQAGLLFEKRGEAELAGRLYRSGNSGDCHERLVRLLYANGDKASAEELLRSMIDDPASDDAHVFATDFHARKFGGRRTGLCTELLRAGRTITVDDTHRGHPEAGVAGAKRRQGFRVFFAENMLWHALFGLLFWDELFESGQLHCGFDWTPRCLKDNSFVRQFGAQIEARLAAVRSGNGLNLILKTIAAKWGRPNGVFAWDHVDVEALSLLLNSAGAHGVASILRSMSEDFRAMRDGFPDLMLVGKGKGKGEGEISFIEVKAEGDVIRRNQLTRLRQLGNAGIPAEIGRVDYRFDPGQDYVVVDIETTGCWSSGDRITEIGAVKIRNHEVVGEWHSLINPQRSIPAKIVALTGISNAMVRDAPLFAEIADSLMAFMADGIFVAHNVNFDYGFIAGEYQRLQRRFRFPKLCTCAGMRRRYPGHKSYGLGPLCALYDISLDDHHRALCDARAAAHLLNLINRKRVDVTEMASSRAA
jgi:DNA polymerase III subunit epsilon